MGNLAQLRPLSEADTPGAARSLSPQERVAQTPQQCDLCFGTGFEVIEGKGARRCRCLKAASGDGLFKRAQIPEIYSECTLANYHPAPGAISQLRALTFARQLVVNYPVDKRGLLLMGSIGTGKTHLATGIIRDLISKNVSCLFYNFSKLLKDVQRSYDRSAGTSEAEVLTPVLTAPVLVLDELGAVKPTTWVHDQMLYVISTRYDQRLTTILTTNYSDTPSAGEESLEERIGSRLRSRLHQMSRVATLDGTDYRTNFAS